MGRHAFIIGGTGQIGSAVARKLLDQGWNVSAACRSVQNVPAHLSLPGIEIVTMDRDNPRELERALGCGADLLVDTVGYDAPHAEQLLGVQEDVGQLLTISSASVYCDERGRTLDEARQSGFPELPIGVDETQPTVAPGQETYSTRKVAMERVLLDGARVPAAVLRPCAIHGSHSRHPREWWFVKRLLDRRIQIPLAYEGRSQFQTSATANIAGLVAVIGERPFTGILNAVDPTAPTVAEIGRSIMAAIGREAMLVPVPDRGYPPRMGASPWGVPKPFVFSDDAARAIGFTASTDYVQAVGATCRWLVGKAGGDWQALFPLLAAYPFPLFDYAAEDTWLNAEGLDQNEIG